MYFLRSKKNGSVISMKEEWIPEYEKIKWNEYEKVVFNEEYRTEIETIPGRYQGHRVWNYHVYDGDKLIDYGNISS